MKYRFFIITLLYFGTHFLLFSQQYDPPANDQEFEKQYQERIVKDRLNGIYIPKNLDDALAQLNKLSSEESKAIFKNIPEDSVCLLMHNRIGQWMIVNWSFYEGSRLSNYLHSAGVTYPDDMADFLILAFHRQLNQKPVSIKELATLFREKRQAELQDELQKGKVIKEETRQRSKPADAGSKQRPGQSPKTPAEPALTPKGGGGK